MLWVTMTMVVAAPLPEPQQLEVEAFAGERIERAERFVEQEHGGLERKGTGERDALGGPAGQLRRAGVRDRRVEVDEVDQRADPGGSALGGPAGQVERIGDVVGGRAPRQQARLLEDQPDARVGAVDRRVHPAGPCRSPGRAGPR